MFALILSQLLPRSSSLVRSPGLPHFWLATPYVTPPLFAWAGVELPSGNRDAVCRRGA